jgi:hypothetical protein
MAKTLKTSGDYTIKAGAGSAGIHTIKLDAQNVRIPGNFIIDGTQTVINSTTLTVDDPFIEVIRNNSGTDLDGGLYINRGGAGNNAVILWDEGADLFKVATTTDNSSTSPLTNITLAKLQVANPTANEDAANKFYVDAQISGGGFSINFSGDDSASISINTGSTVYISGGNNITTTATEEPDQINVNLNRDLNGIDSISTDRSNQDLTLTASGTGEIVVSPVLTFTVGTANPTATASTKVYNKTAGGGGTGLYFKNSNINSGAEGELISKSKATALAIALG